MNDNKNNTFDNLPEAIQSDILTQFRSKRRRILHSPWSYFPNITDFEIKLTGFNKTLEAIGIEKSNPPILSFNKYVNQKMNRYLENQIRRLEKLRNNPVAYWRVSVFLMSHSNIFLASAIHKVMHNWYKNYPLVFVWMMVRKVRKITREWRSDFTFSRVYIPKPGTDRVRPLGVPTMEWRIVLHMWNCFLMWYVKPHLLPQQHAFIPEKGTLTAWKDIIRKKVWKHKYIYEMDLRQFFPSVNLSAINQCLKDFNVPWNIIEYLDKINRNNPKLPDDLKLDERKYIW